MVLLTSLDASVTHVALTLFVVHNAVSVISDLTVILHLNLLGHLTVILHLDVIDHLTVILQATLRLSYILSLIL